MVKPLGARALVKRLEEPKLESSLIEIPDTIVQKPSVYALVLAIGTLVQGGFQAGDVVILKDYSGAPIYVDLDGDESDKTECAFVVEEDVLAVVEGM